MRFSELKSGIHAESFGSAARRRDFQQDFARLEMIFGNDFRNRTHGARGHADVVQQLFPFARSAFAQRRFEFGAQLRFVGDSYLR